MFDLVRRNDEKVRILGHRGAMGHAPENTMASFKLALEMGADMIELDVHLSRDNVPVVIHDEDVKRTTDGEGQVSDMNLEELKELDAGSWFSDEFVGERIPTLAEVMEWARGKVPVNVEIKNGPNFYEGIEEAVVEVLKETSMTNEVIISSFDHVCLRTIKEVEPRLATAILYSCRLCDPVRYAKYLELSAFHPRWTYVTEDFIKDAHGAELAVNAWIANTPGLMTKLIDMGVDMIGTNYPDRLRDLLSSN